MPNIIPPPNRDWFDNSGLYTGPDSRTLPGLQAQRSANLEASATLEEIDASLWDLFASGELEEFAVTIAEYGFGPSLTVPVILMWSLHLPECLKNFSTPIIWRNYNIALGSRGVKPTSMAIGSSPRPQHPPPTSQLEPQSGPPRVKRVLFARDTALSYLHGHATSEAEKSARTDYFERLPGPIDCSPSVPLEHGGNISSVHGEERGSVGVFLAPHSNPAECYFLSAQHVFSGPPGSSVQTPSHLDTLRQLARIVRKTPSAIEEETRCKQVLHEVKPDVAILTESSIGVDDQGWRKDWALCRVRDGYVGVNGRLSFGQVDDLRVALRPDGGSGFQDGLGVATAMAGDTVFKLGATSSASSGIVNETNFYIYRRMTAEPAGDIPYGCTTLRLIFRHWPPDIPICADGDAGAGVFTSDNGKLSWVGLLVGAEPVMERGWARNGDIGLMIPQDIILSQIQEETKTKWGLYHAPVDV